MREKVSWGITLVVIFAAMGGLLSLVFRNFISFGELNMAKPMRVQPRAAVATVRFNPPEPKDAPEEIREAVMLGYNILMETRKYAPKYVGNKLSCKSCHFQGGLTPGGENGGLSLVGVAATYPQYKKRENYSVDLATRTNDCFQRSMNGKPLPGDSKEMTAIVTYYHWISKGLPIYAEVSWLGLKHLPSQHKPDPEKGRELFSQKCVACHGDHGQGTQIAPPLWGPGSFNDGAGMNKLENLAAFSHGNMPFKDPDLTDEESLDIAAYVIRQPRPHFKPGPQKKG